MARCRRCARPARPARHSRGHRAGEQRPRPAPARTPAGRRAARTAVARAAGPPPGQPGPLGAAAPGSRRHRRGRVEQHGDRPAAARRARRRGPAPPGSGTRAASWPSRMARSRAHPVVDRAQRARRAPSSSSATREHLAQVRHGAAAAGTAPPPARRRSARGRCGSRPGRSARWPARSGSRAWCRPRGPRADQTSCAPWPHASEYPCRAMSLAGDRSRCRALLRRLRRARLRTEMPDPLPAG